jgi:hypothetical protein
MSLSYERLDVVEVRDPRTILENKRDYAVLRAGSQTTWKQWTTTSVSQNSIQFSFPPPSGQVIVDRKMYMLVPIRLTFAGEAGVGNVLLNPGQDAPRAWPLMSSIDTLQLTVNNQSVSINIADMVQALMHFNTPECLSNLDYSMTPTLLDQSQAYSNLFGTNRNPLGFYGDSHDQVMQGRAGFPFTVVSNTQTTAVVDMVVCEPILLSPLYWGHENASGFYNVNTMDLNVTFLTQAGNRMWSHDAVSTGVATTISSVSATFNNFSPAFSYSSYNVPYLFVNYITPNETQILPFNKPITYPYFDVQRFPTDYGNISAGQNVPSVASNNIQLNSIPRRMYIYAREKNADLYNTPNNPDTYLSIEGISIQFMNKNGLLASASKYQLYEMAVKNHCQLSWTQWSGEAVYPVNSFVNANKFSGPGSILCVEFATDIGLDFLDSPGKLGQYQLQVNLNVTNRSARTINTSLYIIIVSEGTFTVEGLGKASTNIGVISSQDILDARQSPFVNYCDVQEVNGGNFLSGLKNFGHKFSQGIQKYGPKAWDFVKKDLIPVAKEVAPLLPLLGLGEQCMCPRCRGQGCDACGNGGVLIGGAKGRGVSMGGVPVGGVAVGGRQMSKKNLKDRLHRLNY